jgi:hypothetical protein
MPMERRVERGWGGGLGNPSAGTRAAIFPVGASTFKRHVPTRVAGDLARNPAAFC